MRANRWLHFVDRYFGIALIFLLGLFKPKKRCCPSQPYNIALLNTAAIGDTILISGVIADLKEHFPESTLTFFVGPSNEQAALLIEGIQVVKIEVVKVLQTIQTIRKHSFDVWIDFGQWPRINALYSFFAKAAYKIGFRTLGQYRHYIYDAAVSHQPIHEIENFRNLLRPLGINAYHLPKIGWRATDKPVEKQIVMHLYAGGSQAQLKQWPESSWVCLIQQFLAKGYQIYLTGGSADQKRCEQIKADCASHPAIHVVAGALSLKETAQLLMSSEHVISVDTGIMHLAACLGCSTIALHGPTSPARWGGLGEKVIVIQSPTKRPACLHLGFEKKCKRCSCMAEIRPEEVWKQIL